MAHLHARVSDEAYDGWRYWADKHGITLSSWLEAIGEELGRRARSDEPESEGLLEFIERARQIDADRRRRR